MAASGNYAVIAPNMGKQIVAFQTMMEMMAERFPGCFSGYTLQVGGEGAGCRRRQGGSPVAGAAPGQVPV